jgi:hypothetical protein
MAKKRRGRRRGRTGGVGSVITIRRMQGLGALHKPGSFMGSALPPLIGVGVTGITILAARQLAKPSDGPTPTMIFKWAPAIGGGVGLASALALYWLGGAPAAVGAGVASVLTAGLAMVADYQLKSQPGEYALAMGSGAATTQGLGIVVPERMGTRGIMFENPASRDPVNRYGIGAYGQTVDAPLQGITPTAFGRTHLGR